MKLGKRRAHRVQSLAGTLEPWAWADSTQSMSDGLGGPNGRNIQPPNRAVLILLPGQTLTCPVSLECIPDVAIEVVVPCEEEAATLGEGDGGDTTNDVVVGVGHQLLVSSEVKQPAGGVIRASGKCIAIGKELERRQAQEWARAQQN